MDCGNATSLSRTAGRLSQGLQEPDLRGDLAHLLILPLKSSPPLQVLVHCQADTVWWVLFSYFAFFFSQMILRRRVWQAARALTVMEILTTLSQRLIN